MKSSMFNKFVLYSSFYLIPCLFISQLLTDDLEVRFSMNSTIVIKYFFVDDADGGHGTHYRFSALDFERYVNRAKVNLRAAPDNWQLFITGCPDSAKFLPSSCYRDLKLWGIYFALSNHKISTFSSYSHERAIVFGSTDPWLEALTAVLGFQHIYTLDYNNLTFDTNVDLYPPIKTVNKYEFHDFYQSYPDFFDCAFALSSFDHDGLGRYGDPIEPNADLTAMNNAWKVLKPGGILFLSVPIGPDLVVYNLHRRYGHHRLPKLLEGWVVIDRIGWNDWIFRNEIENYRLRYEPVFLLRKSINYSNSNDQIICK